jgi:hypothetical protein
MTGALNHPHGPPFIAPSWRESLPALEARLEKIEKRLAVLEDRTGGPQPPPLVHTSPPAMPVEGNK